MYYDASTLPYDTRFEEFFNGEWTILKSSYFGVYMESDEGEPDAERLQQHEEQTLFFHLESVGGEIEGALEREAFTEAMAALAHLRRPVDAFFDRVTVNSDDSVQRENRLCLLAQIRSALGTVADFSLIEDADSQERRVA
jgi:glycyl-tRNA synthetase beta subunit